MIYTYLATATVSAALAFGSAWQIQSWRNDANENHRLTKQLSDDRQRAEEEADAQRELHVMEQKRRAGVIDALNVAKASETALRADAARSRAAPTRQICQCTMH